MIQRFRPPATRNSRLLAAAILCISVSLSLLFVDAFSPTNLRKNVQCRRRMQKMNNPTLIVQHLSKIIDAEVIPDDEINNDNSSPELLSSSNNLVEYSQNQDPEWKTMPVAFCDTESNTYIDCNLAFYVKDPLGDDSEGAEYALGVPCDVPIVVALELEDGSSADAATSDATVTNLAKVVPINPDDNSEGNIMREEEKEEIFQIAARALMDEFGPQIRLKKTPRVLTMEGDLDAVIGDWKEVLLGSVSSSDGKDKVSFEEALNAYDEDEEEDGDNDEEEDYFDMIMKRDLGPDYMKLVDDDDDDDEMDEALLKLFDPEGLDGDLDELMDDINDKENKIKDSSYEQLVQQLQPSSALKLLNFLGPGGKEYTILRPLRPILLVGKEDPDDYTRRILLTKEERETILPRLESACREGLEKAGFFLAGSGEES